MVNKVHPKSASGATSQNAGVIHAVTGGDEKWPSAWCVPLSSSRALFSDRAYLRKVPRPPSKARTAAALEQAITQALQTVTADNAAPWFRHCGYGIQQL